MPGCGALRRRWATLTLSPPGLPLHREKNMSRTVLFVQVVYERWSTSALSFPKIATKHISDGLAEVQLLTGLLPEVPLFLADKVRCSSRGIPRAVKRTDGPSPDNGETRAVPKAPIRKKFEHSFLLFPLMQSTWLKAGSEPPITPFRFRRRRTARRICGRVAVATGGRVAG